MARHDDAAALDRLMEQEDVLQICYWYQGEGFGETFTPRGVMPFLQSDQKDVAKTFTRLADSGDLQRNGDAWVFTDAGRKKAGKMFFETFTEFQQPSHGECTAGCCDGDEVCDDPSHDHGGHGYQAHG